MPDTSTRKSIKGMRDPLTLLAVHKARVEGFISLHYGFLVPPAPALSTNGPRGREAQVAGEAWKGSHARVPRFMGPDHHSTTHSFTNWHTSLHFTSISAHFSSSHTIHKFHYIHTRASLRCQRPPSSQSARCSPSETKRTCFCGPHHISPEHLSHAEQLVLKTLHRGAMLSADTISS